MLVIGLGNPGEKFKNTRHNVGFMVLDLFAIENNFPDFEMSKKHNALISEKNGITLVKPQTFMNESGFSVKKFMKNEELVVIQDDIDIQIGKIKITRNSSSGGHKGVASIIDSIGRQDFIRFKVGICPVKATASGGVSQNAMSKPKEVEKFVIKKFTKEEMDILNPIINKASAALKFLLQNGLEKTMSQFN